MTVGTEAKRTFLLETFPKLQADHIGDSRSVSFEGMVRNTTRGAGVHLVLNSLSDEKLQVSLPNCCMHLAAEQPCFRPLRPVTDPVSPYCCL